MRIDLIRQVILDDWPDDLTEDLIIGILARDEKLIPTLLDILASERSEKSKLIEDMNLELSRAEIGLDNDALNEDDFIQKEIKKFYTKYKDQVGHCFKDYGKLEEPKKDEGLVRF